MKMFSSYHTFSLLAIALVLAFAVPLKAQNTAEDYLKAHNRARARVGVGPLVWNTTVADYALSYAKQRLDCRLILSNGPYGEVLVLGATDLSAEEAVTVMVNQGADYFYDTNTCREGKRCEAYKQVVWRKTVSLGCARVINCANGGSLTICNYDPAGNVAGERPF
ncbi:unnamed protein product [Arabis nemorensis]|uniref:SCP domain-containing protein n=1 Tax=Arabis nemorensis TaxID=586526 RepID=A0A565CA05_9BRAS|nr:unnamed protein product [Arabis nemorensis]